MKHSLEHLRKFVAPEYIFGVGSRFLVGQYAHNLGGSKALLVTDPGIIRAGWVDHAIAELAEYDIDTVVFKNVTPNPRDYEVHEGAKTYLENRCDIIIAVGGGSPMDCAKGIGVVVSNGGDINDYEGVDQVNIPLPPLLCIPTTSGTSADVSQFAIINKTKARKKIAIISKSVVPDVSLVDPETLITMDPFLTACTGIDTLTHAIEALVSKSASYMTDLHALEAIRLVNLNLVEQVHNPDNINAMIGMMQASLQAGLAFSNASLGSVHAMAHSSGGYLDLPHGECNAILLDHIVDYNFKMSEEKYSLAMKKLEINPKNMSTNEKRNKLTEKIRELKTLVGIKENFSAKGMKKDDIAPLSDNAMIDPCIVTNPRTPVKRDIEVLYEEAL